MSDFKFHTPNSWILSSLPDIAGINMGQSPSSSDVNEQGEGIVFFQGKAEFGKLYPTPRKYCTKPTKIASVGDILLSIRAPVGPTNIATETTAIGRGLAAISAHCGLTDPKYLLYYFRCIEPWLSTQGTGSTFKAISGQFIKELKAPLPSFAEQKIIAEKLDTLLAQVDSTKARLEQIPQILKRFRQSILASAVNGNLTEQWRKKNSLNIDNWKKLTLGHIVKNIEAGKNLKCIETPPHDEQYGIIKISAVTWGEYDEDESKTLPDDSLFVESRRIATGDFLISRANTLELLGNPVIVKKVTKNLMLSDKVLRLVMADNDKPWVNIFLRSCYGRREIEFRSTGNQLSMRNIGQKALLEIPMPKPSIEEQHEIVRRVEQLFAWADTIEKQVNNALTRVNNLTQSILAKAFRGELTAQWRAENPDLISGENSAAALLEKIKAERAASDGKKTSRKKS
ncbi:type I restriction endonuclease StySJI subunit S [Salmonella enterica subsp. salamae]|nr:type I restriction endonuclease StySJI subunit S [Salmonella enterica subsp. salamae]